MITIFHLNSSGYFEGEYLMDFLGHNGIASHRAGMAAFCFPICAPNAVQTGEKFRELQLIRDRAHSTTAKSLSSVFVLVIARSTAVPFIFPSFFSGAHVKFDITIADIQSLIRYVPMRILSSCVVSAPFTPRSFIFRLLRLLRPALSV